MTEIEELKKQNIQLQNEKKQYEAEKAQWEIDKTILEEKVEFLTHKLYGKKSEKRENPDQQDLFNEAEHSGQQPESKPEPETIEVIYKRKKGKSARKPFSDSFPRKEIIHDILKEDKTCCCGEKLSVIGKIVTEKLKVIPMQIEVEKHIRLKYACKCCEGVESEGIEPTVKVAPLQPSILPKTIATSSLLSYIVVNKFCDALPFYRQEKIFSRFGIKISRDQMCGWVIKSHAKVKPLLDLLQNQLKSSFLIGIDETTVQVINQPDKSPESKSYMWVFRGGTKEHPIILFHYSPNRKSEVPFNYLEGYKGRIQTDGYVGYELLAKNTDIIHIGCWAHVRRKYHEVTESGGKDGLASQFMDLIGDLYKNERQIKDFPRNQIKEYRQTESKAIIEKLKIILDENIEKVVPKSKLGIAMRYTISEWNKLVRFIDDGLIPIDNNMVENAIRPFVIGRKNWLFYYIPEGAEASSAYYSLIETAKANGLEPYSYLNYVFENVPYCKDNSDYEKLLPMFVDRTKIKKYSLPD